MPFWGYILIAIVALLGTLYFFLISKKGKRKTIELEPPTTDKGKEGELEVQKVIGRTIIGKQYVINDLTLNTSEQMTCQIDHVFINSSGIYVIETKNWDGTIYGKETDKNWTQVLTKTKKNTTENPIKQNKTHVQNISTILGEKLPIYSVVVFIQGNTKKINAPGVYTLEELKELISKKDNKITQEEMRKAYHKLLQADDITVSNERHTQNVKTMLNTCPICGKKLVARNGKNGAFMGCTGYPRCKFTKNI